MRAALDHAGKDLRAALRQVAKKTKQGEALARAADLDPGNFSRALAGERHLDVGTLPAFFAEDQDRQVIQLLCRLCGGKFTPDPEVTPEQRVENLLRACRQSGPAGDAILKAAGEVSP
jgi:hypothetical protein